MVARWAGQKIATKTAAAEGGGGVERTVFMDLVRRDALRGVAPRVVGETRGARDIVESCSGDAEEGEVPQSHPQFPPFHPQGKLRQLRLHA